jgi:hypothetical protein
MPLARIRRVYADPYAPSRSRTRFRGASSQGKASVNRFSDPLRSRIGRHSNRGHASASMTKNHQAIERLESDRAKHEEIDRSYSGCLVAQKRLPASWPIAATLAFSRHDSYFPASPLCERQGMCPSDMPSPGHRRPKNGLGSKYRVRPPAVKSSRVSMACATAAHGLPVARSSRKFPKSVDNRLGALIPGHPRCQRYMTDAQCSGPRWNSAYIRASIVGNCLARALASLAGSGEVFASTAKHV